MTQLIALCSPAMGSGKSEVARHLVAAHGFVHVAFASPLKSMAMGLLTGMGMASRDAYDRVYGSRKEEVVPGLAITSRRLQQMLGTEFGRQIIRDTLWVDLTVAAIGVELAAGRSVVVDDMRFPNELDAILDLGGRPYRVVRPDVEVTSQHVSEGQLDSLWMPLINNHGSLETLRATVDSIINRCETVSHGK